MYVCLKLRSDGGFLQRFFSAATDLPVAICADEKNPTSKEIIMKRVEGYMTRAEQLRGMLEKENAPKPVAAAVDMDK